MRLEVLRRELRIVPETDMEEVWIEEIFGLMKDQDTTVAERVAQYPFPGSLDRFYISIRRRVP